MKHTNNLCGLNCILLNYEQFQVVLGLWRFNKYATYADVNDIVSSTHDLKIFPIKYLSYLNKKTNAELNHWRIFENIKKQVNQ